MQDLVIALSYDFDAKPFSFYILKLAFLWNIDEAAILFI